MDSYINKLIGYFSKKHNLLKKREELSGDAINKKEYFNDFLKYELSFLNKLKILDFHTVDYDNTGSYDFHFSIESVDMVVDSGYYNDSLYNEVVRIYINVSPGGTVDIYTVDGENFENVETTEITDSLISNHDYGWEISNEIIDIIKTIVIFNLPELITNTRLFDIVELYINYPLD